MNFALLWLVLGAVQPEPPHIAKSDPHSPEDEAKLFHLPPGFKVELVASEPAIHKPMNFTFDDEGRILLTDTLEYPFPAKQAPRDTIKIIERDGTVRTFATGLNIPIGITTTTANGVIAYSIPKIYRYGESGKREELYGDVEFRDTHGMVNSFTWGLDGWIYAHHGYANQSNVRGSDGRAVAMRTGSTFRFREDGSHVEMFANGQVNPFGICFDPLENLFSADCHSKPGYVILRGAWYPTFGNIHDGLGFGPTLMNHLHGSTAIAGIVYYAATNFPAEFRDWIFIGNVVTCKINCDKLEVRGSSFWAHPQPDFLRSDDPWFRPVDLKLGPDGALYVADFYNRIIGHYEVPLDHPGRDRERGRIWRIYYGNQRPEMPNLVKASVDELIEYLRSDNFELRCRATHQLVRRGAKDSVRAKAILSGDARQRAHGLWVIERLGGIDETTVMRLLDDPDRLVRVHMLRALSERTNVPLDVVRAKLKDPDAFARRIAAEALGMHPDRASLGALLELWDGTPPEDTYLIHTVKIALRNHLQRLAGAFEGLSGRHVAQASLGVPTAEAARLVFDELKQGSIPASREYVQHAARHLPPAALDSLYAFVESKKNNELTRLALATARERGVKGPTLKPAFVLDLLKSADEKTLREGIQLARDLRLKAAAETLERLTKHAALRLAALDALAALEPEVSVPALARVLAQAPQAIAVPTALALASTKEGAAQLLAAVEKGQASARLLQDRGVEDRLRTQGVTDRSAKLTSSLPPEDEQVRSLIEKRRAAYAAKFRPNLARGAEVFEKNCASCHMLGGKGKKIGPELDGIGVRGLERILEDVLDPNRNVDQAFRATIVRMKDGRTLSGLALREEGGALILADRTEEHRIPLAEIEKRALSQLSPMPADFGASIPEVDLLHLVGFLLSAVEKK